MHGECSLVNVLSEHTPNLEQGKNSNSQLSTAIPAPILSIEPQDHDQFIYMVLVNMSWCLIGPMKHLRLTLPLEV